MKALRHLALLLFACPLWLQAAAPAHILLIAGKPSHGPGDHEFRAGMLLIQQGLAQIPGVQTTVASNGWPTDPAIFDKVDAVAIYADGGTGHPAIQEDRLQLLNTLAKRGAGLAFLHYGVEVPQGDPGKAMQEWTGGYYEHLFSCNPMWSPEFNRFPEHPVTRGVQPFSIRDEWYFNMRFAKGMEGVTPILSAIPPDETMSRPDGHHSGNPEVRKMVAEKQPQHVCWTIERPEGGRGFGFTGLHFHDNWANDDFRKTVLNAICWIAKVEIPADGIVTPTPTQAELDANLDPKPAPKPKKG